jgi:hypothetical protein
MAVSNIDELAELFDGQLEKERRDTFDDEDDEQTTAPEDPIYFMGALSRGPSVDITDSVMGALSRGTSTDITDSIEPDTVQEPTDEGNVRSSAHSRLIFFVNVACHRSEPSK